MTKPVGSKNTPSDSDPREITLSEFPLELIFEIISKLDEQTKSHLAPCSKLFKNAVVDQTKQGIERLLKFFIANLKIDGIDELLKNESPLFNASGLKGIKQGLPELKRKLLTLLSQASSAKLKELKSQFQELTKPAALENILDLAIHLATLNEALETQKNDKTQKERDTFVEENCLSTYVKDVDTAVQAAMRIVDPTIKSGVFLQICAYLFSKQRFQECFQLADKLTDQDKAGFINLLIKNNRIKCVENLLKLAGAIQDPSDRQKISAAVFESLAGIDLESASVFIPKEPCELRDSAFEGIAMHLVSQNKFKEALECTSKIDDLVCRSRLLFYIAKEQKIQGLYNEAIDAVRAIPSNHIKSAALTDLLTHSLNLSHKQLMKIVSCTSEITDLAIKKNMLSMMLIFIEKELLDDELLEAMVEASNNLDSNSHEEILERIENIKNKE